MFRIECWGRLWIATAVLCAVGSESVLAQDDRPSGWSDVAELTFVLTGGNASSSTLGLKNTADYYWPEASFQVSAGAVNTRSGITARSATGTVSDFSVTETTDTKTTAANYFVKTRYDRTLSEVAYLFGGAGWDRNTFAGVENRFGFVAGTGRAWVTRESSRFKSDVGLTYTVQRDVVENPDVSDSFVGARATLDLFQQLSETADFASVLVVDENLDLTSDLRADWTSSIAVAMSDRFALKTSLQLLFDNEPALSAIPLGMDRVFTPLDKVDTNFTVAIVATF